MVAWWFWWHSVEAVRYSLWFPYNHVSALAMNRDVLTAPGLTHEQRYIGNTHEITEYIGPGRTDVRISFVDPHELGVDTTGVVAHACGNVSLQRPSLRIATMVHLWRTVPDGLELRSRYWLADRTEIALGPLGELDVTTPARVLGLKERLAGARLAYEQLVHDQVEFTHLASLLPSLWEAFGTRAIP